MLGVICNRWKIVGLKQFADRANTTTELPSHPVISPTTFHLNTTRLHKWGFLCMCCVKNMKSCLYLQMLIEATLKNPNDPYILTDHAFWPLYVELLIASNIVQPHPSDTNRIKLTPFHLWFIVIVLFYILLVIKLYAVKFFFFIVFIMLKLAFVCVSFDFSFILAAFVHRI